MSLSDQFLTDEIHPIDIVEHIAEHHDWDFDRVSDEQIAMAIEGQWRTYSITLAWSPADETLRLICSFEMEPPAHREAALLDVLNRANDRCWAGAFVWWSAQNLMVWRYGLVLSGGQTATPEQVDRMLASAVDMSERFYPAFQLATWGEEEPARAMQIAITEAFGRA